MEYAGRIMSSEQIAQIAQSALQAPLNTLVAIAMILSLVIIVFSVLVIWKFGPIAFRQMQQLIDNNTKQTEISQQNANQIQTFGSALSNITPELVKQTTAIESQTSEIKIQRLDIRNYTTLMNDTVKNHSAQIEANTARLENYSMTLARFEATINALPDQIRAMINDQIKCTDIENAIRALRMEVIQIASQQNKRITATLPLVPPVDGEKPTP